MILLLLLFAVAIESAPTPTPVVLWHGMGKYTIKTLL